MKYKLLYLFILFAGIFSGLGQQDQNTDDLHMVFTRIDQGKEFVYIRISRGQWRKVKNERKGLVAIKLSMRQKLALGKALKQKYIRCAISISFDATGLFDLQKSKYRYMKCKKKDLLTTSRRMKLHAEITGSRLGLFQQVKYVYPRQKPVNWPIQSNEYFFMIHARIIDVDKGIIKKESGILIRDGKIQAMVEKKGYSEIRKKYKIAKEMDMREQFIIPGMSDLHCHLALISEFEMGAREMLYFDAQRMKNAEETLKSGCTLVRDCGGAASKIHFLKREIKSGQLLGPRIISSNGAITPKGGMWDVGVVKNEMARFIFGGKLLWFPKNDKEIIQAMKEIHQSDNDFFKLYFEEKPLYGGKKHTLYAMFSPAQAALIKKQADKYGKHLATHAMFIKGARIAINAGFQTIEHMTCDQSYSFEDAQKMKEKNIALVPTVSLGCYLAMNCGKTGYWNNPEVLFFQKERTANYRKEVEKYVIPQLQTAYLKFFEWLDQPMSKRKMPMVGQVYPKRIHNFARLAPKSFVHLKKANTKIGIGTDGGTGITFCGNIVKEMKILQRYDYKAAQLLRMATLGNMEILRMEKEFGSIDVGKYADLVVLSKNPLKKIKAVKNISMVFVNGRLQYQK